jgi:hypothetical protein
MNDEERRRHEARLHATPVSGPLKDAVVSAFNLACSVFFDDEQADIDWIFNPRTHQWEIHGSTVPPEVCALYIAKMQGEA